MTDLMVWGGPVYCNTLDKVAWRRPTKVLCKSREGASNIDLFNSYGPGPVVPKLAAEAGIPMEELGSVGFGGFSAFHQFINPILKNPEDLERIDYVHLADACFQGQAATNPHLGFLAFAKKAAAGKARMTITSNGPRGSIHYSYGGTNYDLISGTSCVDLFYKMIRDEFGAEYSEPRVPDGMPAPSESHQIGQLIWLGYDNSEHAAHANKLAAPMIDFYGAPWMAGEGRGLSLDKLGPVAGALLVGGAAYLAYKWRRGEL